MAKWHGYDLSDTPLKGLVEETGTALGTMATALIAALSVLKAALEVVRVFLVGEANAMRAIVTAALYAINQLVTDLEAMGLYMLMVVPEMKGWPDHTGTTGGIDGFFETVRRSIDDPYDPNRPQASSWAWVGGTIVVVQASDISQVIGAMNSLLALFGWNKQIGLPPVSGVTAGVVGTTGNILTDLDALIGTATTGTIPKVQVRWPSFDSFFMGHRVERSKYPGGLPVIIKEVSPQRYELRVAAEPGELSNLASDEDVARDVSGALVSSFDLVDVVPPLANQAYVEDEDVELGSTYYYQARLYTDNPWMVTDPQGRVTWRGGQMGPPSAPIAVTIPYVLPGFNLAVAVRRTLNAATNVGSKLLGSSDQEAVAALRLGTDAYSALYENCIQGQMYRLTGRTERIATNALTNLIRSRSIQESFRKAYNTAFVPIGFWSRGVPEDPSDAGIVSEARIAIAQNPASPTDLRGVEKDRATIDEAVRIILWAGLPLGDPPNWISIRPFRDLLPSVAQMLDTVMALLNGLADATADLSDAIDKVILALESLIDLVERILRQIEAVGDLVARLNGSFSVISLTEKGVSQFLQVAEDAEGKPASDSSAYAAGVVFLGDLAEIPAILDLIFGG